MGYDKQGQKALLLLLKQSIPLPGTEDALYGDHACLSFLMEASVLWQIFETITVWLWKYCRKRFMPEGAFSNVLNEKYIF